MIARLRGRTVAQEKDSLIVDVGGVGYRVFVPAGVQASVESGSEIVLHTYMHVRENEVALYGAGDRRSLEVFRLLLGVTGVGPRVAMAILSTLGADSVQQSIASEAADTLTLVPGVGRKLAQRIVLELRGRLGEAEGLGQPPAGAPTGPIDPDALAALQSLGYSQSEAQRALQASAGAGGGSTEERVLAALRAMGRG